jgi:hypothetical protein
MPPSWLSRTGKSLSGSPTVITSLLLLIGYPGLEDRPPVVNPATNPEVGSEKPLGPSLFLAAARDTKLDLNVERGEHVGFRLGHIWSFHRSNVTVTEWRFLPLAF